MPKKVVQKVVKQLKYWSWSAYALYKECPRRFRYEKLEKRDAGPKGPAMERGTRIHNEGEQYLKEATSRVPLSFAPFGSEMRALRKLKAASEASWGFTRNWQPSPWSDFDNTWLRTKLDSEFMSPGKTYVDKVLPMFRSDGGQFLLDITELCNQLDVCYKDKSIVVSEVIDFKTGKIREGYGEQTELYALATLKRYPEVSIVAPSFWFLDAGEIVGGPHATRAMPDVPTWYTRSQEKSLQAKWDKRATTMLNDTQHVARPGFYCSYCPFSKAKGGPCEFGG